MLDTHRDAECRYEKYRTAVLTTVNRTFGERGLAHNARLIDQDALRATIAWGQMATRRVDWDWLAGYSAFRYRYPKRFEMALWSGGRLVSLTLGRPTYTGTRMRLDFIEAAPDKPADVKVFDVSLFAIATYAELLGASELRVMNPINQQVREYYEKSGLVYDASNDYLYLHI